MLKSDLEGLVSSMESSMEASISSIREKISLIPEEGSSCKTWRSPCNYALDGGIVYYSAPSHWNTMKVHHDRMIPNIHSGSIFFIGDSHFQGLATPSINPFSVNLGIGGDTMRGVINRTSNYTPLKSAGAVCLLIGVNDFSYEGANWVYNVPLMIDKLLKHFSGGPLFWLLIPPIKAASESGYLTQENINTTNSLIVSKASSLSNVHIIDISTPLKNGGTHLDNSYSLDGIHLNGSGQLVIINKLKEGLVNHG